MRNKTRVDRGRGRFRRTGDITGYEKRTQRGETARRVRGTPNWKLGLGTRPQVIIQGTIAALIEEGREW